MSRVEDGSTCGASDNLVSLRNVFPSANGNTGTGTAAGSPPVLPDRVNCSRPMRRRHSHCWTYERLPRDAGARGGRGSLRDHDLCAARRQSGCLWQRAM